MSHLQSRVTEAKSMKEIAQGETTEGSMRKSIISYNGDRKGMVRKTARTLAEYGIIEGKGGEKSLSIK